MQMNSHEAECVIREIFLFRIAQETRHAFFLKLGSLAGNGISAHFTSVIHSQPNYLFYGTFHLYIQRDSIISSEWTYHCFLLQNGVQKYTEYAAIILWLLCISLHNKVNKILLDEKFVLLTTMMIIIHHHPYHNECKAATHKHYTYLLLAYLSRLKDLLTLGLTMKGCCCSPYPNVTCIHDFPLWAQVMHKYHLGQKVYRRSNERLLCVCRIRKSKHVDVL